MCGGFRTTLRRQSSASALVWLWRITQVTGQAIYPLGRHTDSPHPRNLTVVTYRSMGTLYHRRKISSGRVELHTHLGLWCMSPPTRKGRSSQSLVEPIPAAHFKVAMACRAQRTALCPACLDLRGRSACACPSLVNVSPKSGLAPRATQLPRSIILSRHRQYRVPGVF